jgi:phosphate transport system permease protein
VGGALIARLVPADLRITPHRRRREQLIRASFLGAAGLSIGISGAIVLSLLGNALHFLANVDPSALITDGWFPRRGMYDIATIAAGTLVISVVAMLVATPLGLGAGIYLSEYAGPRSRRVLKPALEVLASIPSVVLGFFALTWISPSLVQRIQPDASDFNLAAAGIGVGILTIPLIASISEDSMRAVPRSLREASYGLGARRLTTSLRIVVPAALSGIVAAIILGVSRAIGETMVVAIAAGGSGGSQFTANPFDQGQTVTAAMAALSTGTDQAVGSAAAFQSLFFLGLVLFLVTFALNQFGDFFVRRTRLRY